MENFPTSLPYPLQNGYSETIAPNVSRVTMSDGYVKQRVVCKNALNQLSVSWSLTGSQYQTFYNFWQNKIHEGMDWFNLKIRKNNALTNAEVRFQSGKFTKNLACYGTKGEVWTISATLDVRR